MIKNKITISKELCDDLKKYANKVAVGIASTIRDEMFDEAKNAIHDFYSDYTPINYKRHYYNFSNKSFKKYYYNGHNSIVRGGIELTPYLMDDIYSSSINGTQKYLSAEKIDGFHEQDLTDYVFNLVYSGYHGNMSMINSAFSVPVTNPSPYERLLNKRDSIIKNINKYKNIGINRANQEFYRTLF